MKVKDIIYSVILAGLIVSCGNALDEQLSAEGYMDLRVTMDSSVNDVTVTKSLPEVSDIAVKIVSAEGKTVYQCADINALEGPLKLKAGDYHVYATCGTEAGVAAFDSPFYTGDSPIQVRAFTVTQAKVVCELAGVMATVSFSQEIKENFKYSFVVDNGLGHLTFDSENEDREGYFSSTGELNWVLNLENAKGEKFVIKDSYSGVQSKEHYAFDFSLETDDEKSFGVGEFRIILDNSLNETYHTPTIWINEDGPSISGMDSHEIYVSDAPSAVLYRVQSTRQYAKLMVGHSDSRLVQCGLPYSSELVAEGAIESFTENTGIAVKVYDESESVLDQISADARFVDFDFESFVGNLPVGQYEITVYAENQSGLSVEKKINLVVKSCINLLEVSPWAEFMFVKGDWKSESLPSGLKVQYRRASESAWRDFNPEVSTQFVVNHSNKIFKAFICGLVPESDYQVRVVTADEESSVLNATTEKAAQIYNSNFDSWYQSGKTWYPYAQNASSAEKPWDSANKGVTTITNSNTVPTSAAGECIKGNAVKMTTIWVSAVGITKLAAGNLFTGKFNGLVGMSGADLTWGIEFQHRPLGYKGYYRYDSVNINRTGDGYDSYNGKPDYGQIQVILQDAGQPYFVVPTTYNGKSVNGPTLDRSKYCDLDTHPTVIARGVLNCDDTGGKFKEVVLPLTYRSLTRIPSHGIATFASSYLGDYFTGGEGSVMWADEFEFIYDPLELPADARDAFFELFDK